MSSIPPLKANLKRKQPGSTTQPTNTNRNAKRAKISSLRTIFSQSSDKALSKNGELDVSAFVKAREYEIRALEKSMGDSKKALSTRAFQQVPRELRRRTASHNVKRVPKRLRDRAAKEMKEDNTPTVTPRNRNPTARKRLRVQQARKLQGIAARARARKKAAHGQRAGEVAGETTDTALVKLPQSKKGALANPPKPNSKYRKRQMHKSWLPTHLFHSKRAHMTSPKEPLWRFAIATTPIEKTYRATHRAGSLRGCLAWDMSYMSTIGVEGVEPSLLGVLRSVCVPEDLLSAKKGINWRRGTRSWCGWVRERDGERRNIAAVQVVWCMSIQNPQDSHRDNPTVSKKKELHKRNFIVRVHPSAFLQLWGELLKVAKMQRPPALVEDLRFEVGSIEVMGPGATEALIGVLVPSDLKAKQQCAANSHGEIWPSLAAVTNPAVLPADALLGFEVSDPRLRHPPRTVEKSKIPSASEDLLQALASWQPDRSSGTQTLFDRSVRFAASRTLPSQKSINRRKGAAPPGSYPSPLATDPRIPILLLASRPQSRTGGQGSWTLLLPWKCVVPVWYSLMYYPLSTGGNPRFGGLHEKRQISFEQAVPWFPGDFPGTMAGWEWEMCERVKRKADWEKWPKGKRIEWESVDLGAGKKGEIGLGWACDWERLFKGPPLSPAPVSHPDGTPEDVSVAIPSFDVHQLLRSSLASLPEPLPHAALATVVISLIHRGVPTTCSRIYRLPTTNPVLRLQWLTLAASTSKKPDKGIPDMCSSTFSKDAPLHERRAALAASLVGPYVKESLQPTMTIRQAGDPSYPAVPGEEDLIGFVTTGNFNLGEGRGTGIGCVAMARILDGKGKAIAKDGLCIVREAGMSLGRVARWEII